MKCLYNEFKRFEGQPVLVYTDDGRKYVGLDLYALEDAVRIIDKCGRLILIEYSHIDAVVEPQMRLDVCCKQPCDCNDDDDFGSGNYGGGNGKNCG